MTATWHCTVCGSERKSHYLQLCGSCYHRQHYQRARSQRRRCTVCKRLTDRYVRAMCSMCYTYWRRHGRNRPRRYKPETCTNCGKPLPADSRRGGLCRSCYGYERKTGRTRPERLWRRYIGPLGWCDCGKPAVEQLTVVVLEHTETLCLCIACAASERDWQRIRGVTGPKPHALRRGAG